MTGAGPLAKALRERRVIADKKTIARVWRATWTQWVQCEPRGVDGAAFWFGKPAVIAWDGVLYAGYYVERGYPAHQKPEYVMDVGWHWNLFLATLENTSQRQRLSECMEALSESRRCVLLLCDQKQSSPVRYKDETSLEEMRTGISSCCQGKWVDLIWGCHLASTSVYPCRNAL